jgi:hypothetical protein
VKGFEFKVCKVGMFVKSGKFESLKVLRSGGLKV